ncbi:MAG TPA: Yip1 family protein [Chloroflexota bacterium]|nr:Yip1 family protein [Chloroflexota bacterium]
MTDTIGGITGNGVTSGGLVNRMIRAARLDTNLYEEVEADKDATTQAAIVVVIVAVCSAIGAALSAVITGSQTGIVGGVIGGLISAIVGWLIWAYVTYFIGTRMFGGTATPGELLRTIGFANSPGVLNLLGFIPIVGPLIRLVVFFWLLVAGVVAVRQALDFDTGKAVITTVIGWLALLIIPFILAAIGLGAAAATFGM